MEETPKRGKGRPAVAPANKKRNRAISLTDAEYQTLNDQAAALGLGPSAYVVKKLNLS